MKTLRCVVSVGTTMASQLGPKQLSQCTLSTQSLASFSVAKKRKSRKSYSRETSASTDANRNFYSKASLRNPSAK